MIKKDMNFNLYKNIQNAFRYVKNNSELALKILIPVFVILFGYLGCTYNQRKIDSNINDVFNIANDIRLNYSNKPDYWRLSTKYVVKNKIINSKFFSNDKIFLDNKKEILIGSGINAMPVLPMQKSFDIVLSNLTKAECISYLEANISAENQVNLYKISVISVNEYTFNWGDSIHPLPIKKYTGKDICKDINNTVIWSFI